MNTAPDTTIANVALHIKAHADQVLSLAQLAEKFGLSPGHLQKTFKKPTGLVQRRIKMPFASKP